MKKFLLSLSFIGAFVAAYGQSAKYTWSNNVGSKSWDIGNAVAVDQMENVIVAGSFTDTADLLPGPGTMNVISRGMKDMLIAKYDRGGAMIWSRTFGSALDDEALAVNTDAAGNVYACGYFSLNIDFNPGFGDGILNASGGKDIFMIKLDAFGRFLWAKRIGSSGPDIAKAINIDRFNNVYLTGTFWGTTDFNPGMGTANLSSNGASDFFIARFDQNGNFTWARSIGSNAMDSGTTIANDRMGNVYVAGNFGGGGADFDPGFGVLKLPNEGESDAFVVKLNSAGSLVWARNFGGALSDYVSHLHVSDSGFVYLSGHFSGRVDFNPGTAEEDTFYMEAKGIKDAFVAKLNDSGNFIWAKSFGTTGSECIASSIQTDPIGNVLFAGNFQDSLLFRADSSSYKLTSRGGSDIFMTKLSAAGVPMWAKSMGGPQNDSCLAIKINMAGAIFSTGSFQQTVDFNPAFDTVNHTSYGESDLFLHKMDYCNPSTRVLDDTICSPLTIEGITYDKSGTYKQTITGPSGCEEFLTIKLDVRSLDNSITASGYVLTAVQTGVKYQWIGCKDKNEIPGATGQSYITLGNAQYAVTIFDGHCRDTSVCYDMTIHPPLSIEEIEDRKKVQVFPNPNKGNFVIQCSDNMIGADARIYNLLGQKIANFTVQNTQTNYELCSGFYILEIRNGLEKISRRIIVE